MSGIADLYAPMPEQPAPVPMQGRSLMGYAQQQEAKRADPANYVELTNTGATRNLPLTPALQQNLNLALQAAYGPGYRAQVYSGGQPAIGSGGARVGSTRHDGGNAADLYVLDPQGKRVTGDGLAPLAKHWLSNKMGGAGMEMKGGGIHLDSHTDRSPFWTYGPLSPAQSEIARMYGGGGGVGRAVQQTAAVPTMAGGPQKTMQIPAAANLPTMARADTPAPYTMPQPGAAPALAQFALAQMFIQNQNDTAQRENDRRQTEIARRRALFGSPSSLG